MIIGVQGTKSFSDYSNIFLRAMGVALRDMDSEDKEIIIYAAGPSNINSMCLEFANISERTLKLNGIKIKVFRVPPSWMKQNITTLDTLYYFSKPKEPLSDLVSLADAKDIAVSIYRY